jgi:hypothetical protein
VLGRFNERDLMISKIRWDGRAAYEMPADRTYCTFTNAGDTEVGGRTYGRRTVVWSDLGETVEVTGEPSAEALCIAFPKVTRFVLGEDLLDLVDPAAGYYRILGERRQQPASHLASCTLDSRGSRPASSSRARSLNFCTFPLGVVGSWSMT